MKSRSAILGLVGAIVAAAAMLTSCHSREAKTSDPMSPEEILAAMRADTAWIHSLDSLAGISIGEGAKCVDPVKHLFECDGRWWIFNQDWGGVMELPEGYIPEDDMMQAIVSYHGSGAWSPDSTIYISVYAGLQCFEESEFINEVKTEAVDSFTTITKLVEDEVAFGDGFISKACKVWTVNDTGIVGYKREIFQDPQGVSYAVSVQYDPEHSDGIQKIIDMVDRYPFGPLGQLPKGESL